MKLFRHVGLLLLIVASSVALTWAAENDNTIPRRQTKPPGPPLSPAEAIARMTVPEGFSVELVASEPDIVNPVAMTFDERGRVWITESFEYPRRSPGPGRDRVKILEDTDGDGKADKFTVFAEGLNIPSGIAVGAGGVWVANAPDLLFLQDTDGDGKADKQEVVLTGFGRTDTHELPNSLTWGPDGWLYGINGVFNYSHVEYRGKVYDFTCALFRIHPRTREFELFAQGTSNPWGVAWNHEGSAFISACVIDHLWHLTESGYYHRQGGPYPPFTWKIESIVKHTHQLAAYCGIHFFDSEAYPAKYRDKLYMGNIHGGCINCDVLERQGSSYFARPDPDFLTANDVWFMPVVQKTGPDGCLYVLDWYDRYHCYQDANRDPEGVDRLKGRLYRVRYKESPRASKFDLARETDDQLIERLHSGNVYFRDIAQRLLWERREPATIKKLQALVLDKDAPRKARMHALWAVIGSGPLDLDFHEKLYQSGDPTLVAWCVRAAGDEHQVAPQVLQHVSDLAQAESPDVQLQVAIAAPKLQGLAAAQVLTSVAAHCGEDKLIPHIVWQNLYPLLEKQSEAFVAALAGTNLRKSPGLGAILPRAIERMLACKEFKPGHIADLLKVATDAKNGDPQVAGQCLALLAQKIQTRELSPEQLTLLAPAFESILTGVLKSPSDSVLYFDAVLLAASTKNPAGFAAARQVLSSAKAPDDRRLQALDALVVAGDLLLLEEVKPILASRQASVNLRRRTLDALGRLDDPRVAVVMLDNYAAMEPELQPQAIEVLTQRPAWAKTLLATIASKKIPADVLNVNQVRKLLASKDADLVKQVTATWGSVRTERNPAREQVLNQMRTMLRRTPGDPHAGLVVFQKVCGQCHKIYGQGQEVGPDITLNGRSSFEQLLSNVFDPSLVIGASYQARTVITGDGRILTGLLTEDNEQRVVLKMQGGKLETVARGDVEDIFVSKLSMMPEGLETQLKPQELADLFAFITLDKPPTDPTARQLPGVREPTPRETSDPAKFNELVGEIAPGFTTQASGVGGVAIVKEHQGRTGILRTHPVEQGKPCILRATVTPPVGKKTRLLLSVSHDPRGDWQLIVKANGTKLHDAPISSKTVSQGWAEISVDLSAYAGKKVELELLNQPTDWAFEHGYWGRVEIISE
jgi:putative heme-binding domain-containing protein